MKSLFKAILVGFCVLLSSSAYAGRPEIDSVYTASVFCTNYPDALRIVTAWISGDDEYAVKLLTEDAKIKCYTHLAAAVPYFPVLITELAGKEGSYEIYKGILLPINRQVFVYYNLNSEPET